ncbi:O-antigen ligase family protein [Maritalea myrionectae]|uniref:O-antigen ligase family protein n=1 Tax=Maritalea myrionectae TaxID=454601 RepID=UPI000402DB94|nr:O-antigen ligase family protein [Maritalea myrionectae]
MKNVVINLVHIIFLVGCFILPMIFGSAAGAAALLISLGWTIYLLFLRNYNVPTHQFQIIWTCIAPMFFIIFSLSSIGWDSMKYGFNTIAFVLALGVFIHFSSYRIKSYMEYLPLFATLGLLFGVIWAHLQQDLEITRRLTPLIGGGSNLAARIAILLAAFSTIFILLNHTKLMKAAVYVIIQILTILLVIYAGSRGALLAIPILIVAPIIFVLPCLWLRSVAVWICIFAMIGIAIFGFSYFDPNELASDLKTRLLSVANGEGMDASTERRYQMWQVAFQSFLEHPIIGTGWHSFIEVTEGTILESYAENGNYFNFHSDIANFAVAGGIIGLLLYFLLLFAPLIFWDTPKDHPYFRVRLYWAVIMPILYLVLGLTDMVMGFDYPTMFYAFTFAIIWGLTEQKKGSDIKNGAQTLVN